MRRVLGAVAVAVLLAGAVPAHGAAKTVTRTTFDSPVVASATQPSAGLRARLTTSDGRPLAGRRMGFWQAGVAGGPRLFCTGTTGADGVAHCERLVDRPWLGVGFHWLPTDTDLYAQYDGDRTHTASFATASHARVG